jgi:hypothetical protein
MAIKVVEQLSVVNGVVVAVGFSGSPSSPTIIYDGKPISEQICTRFRRPDLLEHHGSDFLDESGFRIAALVNPGHFLDNSKFAVRFDDGDILRRSIPNIMDAHVLMNEFAADIEAHPGRSLLEIGSRARSGTVYKTRFPSIGKYVGADITDGPNVDVVADAHTLSKTITDKFDYAFSVSTFEHLAMPWVAAYELNKVMKLGGLIYMQSHPTYPLHEVPWDFFRFSTSAWGSLFNRFTGFEIVKTGYSIEASIVVLNATNGAMQGMDQYKTWLVSGVMARKVSEPLVDWTADPASIINLSYSHGPKA